MVYSSVRLAKKDSIIDRLMVEEK